VAGLDTCSFFRLFADAKDDAILELNTLLVSLDKSSSAEGNSDVLAVAAAGTDAVVSELALSEVSSSEDEEEDAYSSPRRKDAMAAPCQQIRGKIYTKRTQIWRSEKWWSYELPY
jgi:hypothetical protein